MKAIPLRTALLVVAVLAAWLAAIKPYAFETRIYRPVSLIKVNPSPKDLLGSDSPSPTGNPADQALVGIASHDSIVRALTNPAVADLPSLRGLPDPAAEVRRHLTVRVIPQTYLIEVALNWTSGAEAATIVDELVADAVAAAPPGKLKRINLALAGGPFRRRLSIVPCALITLAAAMALLLVLVGPGLLRMARGGLAPRVAG